MKKSEFFLIGLFVLNLLTPKGLPAESTDGFNIGKRDLVVSQILGEEREILVSLPEGYENSVERYPVLFILDGRYHFFHAAGLIEYLSKIRRIPPMIVVAVANKDRERDFLPTRMNHIPSSGKANRFLSFIEMELIPYVEKKFRTASFRIIMGHSFGGTFALHAMQQKPDLFQAYIIVSGALWWDNKLLLKRAVPFFQGRGSFDRFIYFSVGDESMPLVYSFREFSKILRIDGPKGLRWKNEYMKSENHLSTPHRSLYRGLEFVFKRWFDAMNSSIKGVDEFLAQTGKLPGYYGYPVGITKGIINAIGYELIRAKKISGSHWDSPVECGKVSPVSQFL